MKRTKLHSNQSGLVSIIVALTFIIIITLITTSFAFLSRRELRQVLDRQLSTQAFYAAESGVNDAIAKIQQNPINIDTCNNTETTIGADQSLSDTLSYTCVLVDENPPTLQFGPIETNSSKLARIQAENSGDNIHTIRISWEAANNASINMFANNTRHYLPQLEFNQNNSGSYANHTGIVRADIVPIPRTGGMTRTTLARDAQTVFLYPLRAEPANQPVNTFTATTNENNKGAFVDGRCNAGNVPNLPRRCNVDITGLNNIQGTNVFYIRLKGLYQPSNVTIQAYGAGGTRLNLGKSQAMIDATGKANDVLRRIQVRVPVETSYRYPEDPLVTTENICKLLSISNGVVTDSCN